jgi:hypothetical protein
VPIEKYRCGNDSFATMPGPFSPDNFLPEDTYGRGVLGTPIYFPNVLSCLAFAVQTDQNVFGAHVTIGDRDYYIDRLLEKMRTRIRMDGLTVQGIFIMGTTAGWKTIAKYKKDIGDVNAAGPWEYSGDRIRGGIRAPKYQWPKMVKTLKDLFGYNGVVLRFEKDDQNARHVYRGTYLGIAPTPLQWDFKDMANEAYTPADASGGVFTPIPRFTPHT